MVLLALAAVLVHTYKPAWTQRVGTYTLVKWDHPAKDDIVQTLYLKDRKGRVVTSIRDFHVGVEANFWEKAPIRKMDLNRDGVPEILLESWTGGAHGSCVYFLWSLGRHPRCLLAYDKNNVNDNDLEFRDLDGDGISEIVSWYDGFAYTVSGSSWPDLPIVFRYEGGRYVDRTARFKGIVNKAKAEVWDDLADADPAEHFAPRSRLTADAVNLLALGDMTGTRRQVWSRLKRKLPRTTYEWLREREPTIFKIIRGRFRRYAWPAAYSPGPVKFPAFPTDAVASPLEG